LGEVEVVKREEYGGLEVDSKVEMIRALVPLGLMHTIGAVRARAKDSVFVLLLRH